jgi:hypothetical protein
MSMRRQVDQAVLAMLKRGLPQYAVLGLEDGAERTRRISEFGEVLLRDGDAGDPEIDLSPPTYHYDHRIPVEIAAYKSSEPLRVVLDRMGGEIGAVIAANRFLGGLASYMEATALEMADLISGAPGGQTQKGAAFDIVVNYSTTSPL